MTIRTLALLLAAVIAVGCEAPRLRAPSPPLPALTVHTLMLPSASASGVSLDCLAYDRAHHRVWVPAGETGAVAVVDTADDHITLVRGFATAEMERHGTRRLVGPSSATVGNGVVYVGNRADSSVCAVDAESLRLGPCLTLASMPDGLAYVASAKEVWATTPRQRSIAILDAADAGALTWKGEIDLAGAPEGFAVDNARGVFYTNLEDRDRTLTVDIVSRQVVCTWLPGCGEAGPRGLALDHRRNVLVVACPDHVVALDAGHDGTRLSAMNIGDGLDSIDLVESRHELYMAAARAATLTIAHLDAQGGLTPLAIAATRAGARNAVATDEGVAYVTDGGEGKILVVTPRLGD
ncbi:MAG: hypothetical protein HY271_09610 [Deltaproteobacteria bacterium]|nr:hypothetical protein [Deltaproteobacteria bacterium]